MRASSAYDSVSSFDIIGGSQPHCEAITLTREK